MVRAEVFSMMDEQSQNKSAGLHTGFKSLTRRYKGQGKIVSGT
jgi:hypothetical protein